jgi:hypothetical protein
MIFVESAGIASAPFSHPRRHPIAGLLAIGRQDVGAAVGAGAGVACAGMLAASDGAGASIPSKTCPNLAWCSAPALEIGIMSPGWYTFPLSSKVA